MTPRTSIVIPCFNAAVWLRETLASCFSQSDPDLEVVVVDDGSTDGSGELLRALTAREARLRVVHQENRGVGAARNAGLAVAAGAYVNFVDADDVLDQQKVAVQAAILEANPSIDLVLCDGWGIDEDGVVVAPHVTVADRFAGPVDLFDVLFSGGQFPPVVPLVRRALVVAAGGFDEDPDVAGWADTDLWLRLAHRGARYHYLDQHLCRYRMHPGSMSTDDGFMEACARRVYARFLGEHPVASTVALRALQRRVVSQELALASLRAALHRLDAEHRQCVAGTSGPASAAQLVLGELTNRLETLRRALTRRRYTEAETSDPHPTTVGLFGTGAGAMKVWDVLLTSGRADVVWFADNDTGRQGQELLGIPVLAPADALARPVHGVIVSSASRDVIEAQLTAMGCTPDRILSPPLDVPFAELGQVLREGVARLPPAAIPLAAGDPPHGVA